MIRPNYDSGKYPWYSPKKVIQSFIWLAQNYGDNIHHHLFKKAREMHIAAITLLGAYKLSSDNKYFLQLNKQSDTPDVIATALMEVPGELITLVHNQMELVEFEDHHSGFDVYEFLKQKKLSSNKKYDKHTMIICLINKIIQLNTDDLVKKLNELKPEHSIYIVGRADESDSDKFVIFSPYPDKFDPITFGVSETANSYELPESVMMVRGGARQITFRNLREQPIDIYEALGVDETKVKYLKKPNYE